MLFFLLIFNIFHICSVGQWKPHFVGTFYHKSICWSVKITFCWYILPKKHNMLVSGNHFSECKSQKSHRLVSGNHFFRCKLSKVHICWSVETTFCWYILPQIHMLVSGNLFLLVCFTKKTYVVQWKPFFLV